MATRPLFPAPPTSGSGPALRRRGTAPGTRRWQPMIVGSLLATIVMLGLAGCGHSKSGLGRLTVDGQTLVFPAHGGSRAGHSGDILRARDRVQVIVGQATVRLLPGGMLQLGTGADFTIDKTSRLASGAILIQANGPALQVLAQAATLVVASGVAQLAVGSAATGLLVKVYQGQAHLDIPGNPPAPVAAPRQISLVPETRLPVTAVPLHYLDSDPWDHRYLSEAEVISTQLGAAASGFNSQVPAGQGKDAAFYQALVPNLKGEADFPSAFASVQRSQPGGTAAAGAAKPGDYLIASVIALRGASGTFESRLTSELVFSRQGAPWGFVAYDQGVTDLTAVLNDVLGAIGRAALPVGGSGASQIAIGPPVTSPGSPTTRPVRGSAPTTTTTTAPSNPGQPRPPTTTTTAPVPLIQLPVPVLPGPLGSLLNPLLDPLIQALNNLLGGHR